MSVNSDTLLLQKWAGVTQDSIYGAETARALVLKLGLDVEPTDGHEWHHGLASSFADPADVRAFKKCKATGKSDQECFKVGDNGVGVWGQDTSEGSGPSCALPPDDMIAKWGTIERAKNKKVIVAANDREIEVVLKDRMPWKKNIKNDAIIDLNPDAVKSIGLAPPIMTKAKWRWA